MLIGDMPDHARNAATLPKHRHDHAVELLRRSNQRCADDRIPNVSRGNLFGARADPRHDLVRKRLDVFDIDRGFV